MKTTKPKGPKQNDDEKKFWGLAWVFIVVVLAVRMVVGWLFSSKKENSTNPKTSNFNGNKFQKKKNAMVKRENENEMHGKD